MTRDDDDDDEGEDDEDGRPLRCKRRVRGSVASRGTEESRESPGGGRHSALASGGLFQGAR